MIKRTRTGVAVAAASVGVIANTVATLATAFSCTCQLRCGGGKLYSDGTRRPLVEARAAPGRSQHDRRMARPRPRLSWRSSGFSKRIYAMTVMLRCRGDH
jgi:hypothetical protein